MSAFVLDKAHIDFLVTAGLRLDSMRALTLEIRVEGTPTACLELSESTATAFGKLLWTENHRSVSARYPDATGADARDMRGPESYRFEWASLTRNDAVRVLKAIDCYEYQSCEHDGWETSLAKEFCDALRSRAIRNLPGYEEAEWGIMDPLTPEEVAAVEAEGARAQAEADAMIGARVRCTDKTSGAYRREGHVREVSGSMCRVEWVRWSEIHTWVFRDALKVIDPVSTFAAPSLAE